ESKSAYHLGHIAVKQEESSQFASHSLSLGGKLVRSDLSLYLQEERAHCLMNGIYAPAEGQHVDHHTTVHHLVPECSSEQDYKGILTGHSRAVFNGKVIVAKDAQHTDAKQQNKNLLLSANAEIDTKPQLEIFADDVVCSHGATVGQLDEEALFYLATRGIGRLDASRYLIHAFAQNNLRLIPHRDLADWMGQLLTQQLG
uniref:Fe-S cluster assembly protein SufD n=1 Tax=uncultured Legionella sp. TaxID=210934 RepID=UPI00260D9DA4